MTKKPAAAKTAVVAVKEADLPATTSADDFEAHAGSGMGHVTSRDLVIPRLTILQALSPQLDKKKGEYIAGAESGQICDVGTGEVFNEGVLFLPVYYRKDWLEWAPRASGKGLVTIHNDPAIMDQCTRNAKNQPILPNGNLISETAQFFGINLSAGRRKCFLPMASTQLKKARKWLTLATGEKLKNASGKEFTPPLWYRTYSLTTGDESNNEGSWTGWVVTRSAPVKEAAAELEIDWDELKAEILEFIKSLESGEARGDVASMEQAPADTEEAM